MILISWSVLLLLLLLHITISFGLHLENQTHVKQLIGELYVMPKLKSEANVVEIPVYSLQTA